MPEVTPEVVPEATSEAEAERAAPLAKRKGGKRKGAQAQAQKAQAEAAEEAAPEAEQEATAHEEEEAVEASREARRGVPMSLNDSQYAVGWYGRALNTAPLRVWVLAGGESGERDLGLEGAVDMWLRLRSQQDLLVGPPGPKTLNHTLFPPFFLCAPSFLFFSGEIQNPTPLRGGPWTRESLNYSGRKEMMQGLRSDGGYGDGWCYC